MLFAMCVRLAFKHQDATTLSDITPLEKNFSKPSMKQFLVELRKYVDVSSEFETKLVDFIERRHTLIHRWGILHGLPNDDAAFVQITQFSNVLEKDANGLSNVLWKYLAEWLQKFPELRAEFADKASMLSSSVPEEFRDLAIERANSNRTRPPSAAGE